MKLKKIMRDNDYYGNLVGCTNNNDIILGGQKYKEGSLIITRASKEVITEDYDDGSGFLRTVKTGFYRYSFEIEPYSRFLSRIINNSSSIKVVNYQFLSDFIYEK